MTAGPWADGAKGWSFRTTYAVMILVRLAMGTGDSGPDAISQPLPGTRHGGLADSRPRERRSGTGHHRARGQRHEVHTRRRQRAVSCNETSSASAASTTTGKSHTIGVFCDVRPVTAAELDHGGREAGRRR